jgi:acyl carrier protein
VIDDVPGCVLKLIAQEVPEQKLPVSLTADTPLGPDGLAISSMGMVRIFIALEDELGLQLDDALLAVSELSTAGDVVDVVRKAIEESD